MAESCRARGARGCRPDVEDGELQFQDESPLALIDGETDFLVARVTVVTR